MTIAAGTRLGPYAIVAPIGAGGMGEVYKARDVRLDRDVAIKVMGDATSADPIARHRLQREARAASALNHPHICTIYDVGETEGCPFIAMEWIEGESVADRLRALGAAHWALDEVLKIAAQIADGLDAAHSAGVVHRDLKPANLFITKRGDAKILDFGLAKVGTQDRDLSLAVTELTSTGTTVGTVAYMSPEQARGDLVGAASDLFSFGALLYELTTGRAAFPGTTTALIFDAILNRQPRPARELRADVPAALDDLLARLLAKDPSQRVASARALREEIEAIRAGTARVRSSSAGVGVVPSIAVLPFANVSADPENQYIADGVTDEIINTLAQIPGLQVAARTSSFAFRGETPDLEQVSAKLHVAHVLTGSVRRAGPRLRITVQLVKTADGFPLWSERYDRAADDIFAIQDEIAAAIAEKLRVTLTGSAAEAGARRPTDSLEAYDLYLKGNFHINQRGGALMKGLECYQRALALDPHYAPAHSGVAKAMVLLGFYGYVPGYEAMPKARAAARTAIDLDPSLGDPHVWLSAVLWLYDWDWKGAEREVERAIALDPRATGAYGMHALHLAAAHGRFAESDIAARRALELEPLSAPVAALISSSYICAGRYEEAAKLAGRALEFDPQLWTAKRFLGLALSQLGRTDEGIAHLERAVEESGRHPWPAHELAAMLMAVGRSDEAIALSNELIERAKTRYVQPLSVARALSVQGRLEEAFEWLERAYRERDTLPIFRHWPFVVGKTDPRMVELFARIGL